MDLNNFIVLAIVVTSLATFTSRFLGAVTSEKVDAASKLFQWFNYVAYATLAALLARMVIFPAGVLASSDISIRIVVLIVCLVLFIITKKNLIIPTVTAAFLLSALSAFL